MNKMYLSIEDLKNIENPFTELFSLLTRYENDSLGLTILDYGSEELKVMYQHIDTVNNIILQGLQDVGQLIGANPINLIQELNHIGFFISAISNLMEALNTLKSDTDITLKMRGIVDF